MAAVLSFQKDESASPALAPLLLAEAPASLLPAAFHGPVGQMVQKMEPETEADHFALLASTMAALGNMVGRSPFVMAGNSRHYPVFFFALVGETAKARKGTSWTVAYGQAKELDPDWAKNCTTGGMSTGEGLIHLVRDALEKKEPIKEKGKVTGYQNVITDHGITDKRMMVVEGEFGQTLKVMQREGNTLSAVIRNAWDSPDHLRAMSKASASVASNPHITMVGHITREELNHLLSKSDTFNGFANRFIWGYVRRSKLLPTGGNIEKVDFSKERNALRAAIAAARKGGRYQFDADAQALWNEKYRELSSSHPGMLGAVTSRSEAQVMRMALFYALFDGSVGVIRVPHLNAALAVWKFSEDSARFLFGHAESRSDSNRILTALRARKPGMSKNEIGDEVFKRNVESHRINEALATLKQAGYADYRTEETGGRPREVWFSIDR